MKLARPNAAAVMNLVALRESSQWDKWWTRSAAWCRKERPHSGSINANRKL